MSRDMMSFVEAVDFMIAGGVCESVPKECHRWTKYRITDEGLQQHEDGSWRDSFAFINRLYLASWRNLRETFDIHEAVRRAVLHKKIMREPHDGWYLVSCGTHHQLQWEKDGCPECVRLSDDDIEATDYYVAGESE